MFNREEIWAIADCVQRNNMIYWLTLTCWCICPSSKPIWNPLAIIFVCQSYIDIHISLPRSWSIMSVCGVCYFVSLWMLHSEVAMDTAYPTLWGYYGHCVSYIERLLWTLCILHWEVATDTVYPTLRACHGHCVSYSERLLWTLCILHWEVAIDTVYPTLRGCHGHGVSFIERLLWRLCIPYWEVATDTV